MVTLLRSVEVPRGGACETVRSKGETPMRAKNITFKSTITLRRDHELNPGLYRGPLSSDTLFPDANRSRHEGVILKAASQALLPSFHLEGFLKHYSMLRIQQNAAVIN